MTKKSTTESVCSQGLNDWATTLRNILKLQTNPILKRCSEQFNTIILKPVFVAIFTMNTYDENILL